jgi:hypothetical protein
MSMKRHRIRWFSQVLGDSKKREYVWQEIKKERLFEERAGGRLSTQ